MDEAQKWLLTQGVLGLAVVMEFFIIRHLYNRYDKREEWWQNRYDTLMERHNITTEKFAGKGIEAGEALALIAANVRPRVRSSGGGGSGGM